MKGFELLFNASPVLLFGSFITFAYWIIKNIYFETTKQDGAKNHLQSGWIARMEIMASLSGGLHSPYPDNHFGDIGICYANSETADSV